MKIGVDARMYGQGGGIGRYVKELLLELQQIDVSNEYIVFLNEEGYSAFRPTNPRFQKRLTPIRWYTLREQFLLPRSIDREQLDLVHYPHWNIPLLARTPFLVTIHDLILLSQPTSAHRATTLPSIVYKLKYWGFRYVLGRALAHARQIIVVSDFVRQDLRRRFPHISKKKIALIYEGTTPVAEREGRPHPLVPRDPYFLYVGNAFPHKNLESLLHAFSLFHRLHPKVRMVLVGKDDLFYQRLRKEVEEIGLPETAVVFTDFVPDEELGSLYRGATLYLFPSKHEGFGLPPLEAMSYGVPVAASRATALPEILGDAALYFDPDDLEEMVEVMERALLDGALRKELAERGKRRIERYSWRDMAKAIHERYLTYAGT